MDSAVVRSSAAKNSPVPPGFCTSKKLIHLNLTKEQERRLRHRSLFAFRFMVGRLANVFCVDGCHFLGILDCINPDDFSIVLKNTQQKSQKENFTFQNGSTVVFKRIQIAQITIEGGMEYSESFGSTAKSMYKNAANNELVTDGEITGDAGEKQLFGRKLQAASSWLDPTLDTADLEDTFQRRNSQSANWNQFEANEKLFGVVSSFDENIYTTKLDREKIPSEQFTAAERIAREIEHQTSSNYHLQEERGHMSKSTEYDEEARYSSVDRNASKRMSDSIKPSNAISRQSARGPNAYVPPALRNNVKTKQPNSQKMASSLSTANHNDEKEGAVKPTGEKSTDAENSYTTSHSNDSIERNVSNPTKTESHHSLQSKAIDESSPTQTKKVASPLKEAKRNDESSIATPNGSNVSTLKKGLNPNAKEFKLNPSATTFSPKYPATPLLPGRVHPGNVRYTASPRIDPRPIFPPQDEWMYDKGVMLDENDMMPQPYVGYGVPLPPVMMQPPVYPPMIPQHPNGSGQYGFVSPNYSHPYFPGEPLPAPVAFPPRTQPPLPREPKAELTDERMPTPISNHANDSIVPPNTNR